MLFVWLTHGFQSGTGILPVRPFPRADSWPVLLAVCIASIFTIPQAGLRWVLPNVRFELIETEFVSDSVVEILFLPYRSVASQDFVDPIGRIRLPGMDNLVQPPVGVWRYKNVYVIGHDHIGA